MKQTDRTRDPIAQHLTGADADIQILCAAPNRLRVGDALLLPDYNQLTEVLIEGETVLAIGVGGYLYEFPSADLLLIARPTTPGQPCPGCGYTWTEGCNEVCDWRVIGPADLAQALANALLDLDGLPAEK